MHDYPDESEYEEGGVEEGDYTTEDHIHFYQYGKLVVTVPDGNSIKKAIDAHMDKEKFFPNVFFISDHGNVHLINLNHHR
jgi:hypothetical protein